MTRQPQRQDRQTNWSGVTSLITAFTAVGALIFTGLSLNASRDQIAVAEQGQYTERYSRAIEQLGQQGPDQIQIRLGAIYALERLSRDSPRDQRTIVEVLATFVRANAPTINKDLSAAFELMYSPTFTTPGIDGIPNRIEEVGRYPDAMARIFEYPELSHGFCPANMATPPLLDVQAALTVLGRRDATNDDNAVVDLSRTCLRGANLNNANFSHVNLAGADLANTDISNVNLSHANLELAYLAGTTLTKANLSRAYLVGTYLGCAKLTEQGNSDTESYEIFCTRLTNANLTEANLGGARLDGAHLEGDFRGADFSFANLNFTEHNNANFRDTDFFNAALIGADLSRADLAGARLVAADLTGADLRRADLTNADLGRAILTGTDLTAAIHDSNTVALKTFTDRHTKGTWW